MPDEKKPKKKKQTRRDNNDGTIRQRKDGRWEARLLIGYDDRGKPKQQYFYGKSRSEAKEKLDQARAKIHFGVYIEPHKTTLGEWLDAWLERYMKVKLRPTTYASYEMLIRLYLKPQLGSIPLRKLQANDLQACFIYMLEKGGKGGTGLSRRTVEYARTVVKAALSQAVREELINRNPADATSLPPKEKKEVLAFTREEVNSFLQAARNDRLYTAYLLAVATGLRRGELLALRWEDISLDDPENAYLTVNRGLVEVRHPETNKVTLEFQKPKTNKSQRVIPLIAQIVKDLKAHKAKQAEEKLFFGDKYMNNGLVFCTEDGRTLWPSNFNERYSKVLKAAGIEHKKLHALRHTFVSLLAESGEDMKTIQELAGHSSIAVTADIYTHVFERTKRKAVNHLEDILNINRK